MKRTVNLVVVVLASLLLHTSVFAQLSSETWTDKKQKREKLEAGGWKVAYGRQVRALDQLEFGAAIVADALGGSGAATTAYLTKFVKDQVDAMTLECKSVGVDLTKDMVINAFRSRGNSFSLRSLQVDIGVITYRYSEIFYLKHPFGRERQEVPAPPEYQIYIRYRIKSSPSPSPSPSNQIQRPAALPVSELLVDGTFVRDPRNDHFYVIQGGKLYWFERSCLFEGLGYKSTFARDLPGEQVDSLQSGPPIKVPPEGLFIRDPRNDHYYMVRGEKLYHIEKPCLLEMYGYKKENLRDFPADCIDSLPYGQPINTPPEGSLVRDTRNNHFYLIKEGKLRWLVDFNGGNDVRILSGDCIDSLSSGEPIK